MAPFSRGEAFDGTPPVRHRTGASSAYQSNESTATIILLALNADEISQLYDRHAEALLAFLARRTYDPEAAVDLLAETFAAAFEDRQQFRGYGDRSARAWLYGIARHQLTDYFRHGQAEQRALARLGIDRRPLTDTEYDRIEELAASQELRDRVADELTTLPSDQRDAVRLRVVEEQTYESLARLLGISEQTARARVSRGLRALRGTMDLQESPEHA
jgi:RNA polymerase sigma-70 factor, ECF subfamily